MHRFYDRCAYFTAARYMRTIDKVAIHIFKPTNMSPVYSYIMFYLEDYGPSAITDIANGLGYERTTMSRLIDKLEREQLIYITIKGRKSMVSISESGIEFSVKANDCLKKLKELTDNIFGERKKEMTALLTENYQLLEENFKVDQL